MYFIGFIDGQSSFNICKNHGEIIKIVNSSLWKLD